MGDGTKIEWTATVLARETALPAPLRLLKGTTYPDGTVVERDGLAPAGTVLPAGLILPGFTQNWWRGCLKISPACDNCYAEARDTRYGEGAWGPPSTTPRLRTTAANWRKPIAWNREAERTGIRRYVFTLSLGDLFEEHPSLDAWRAEAFAIMERCTSLDWLCLTKRPQNILGMVPSHWFEAWPAHVFPGTTVENQLYAERRLQHFLNGPWSAPWVSAEPLLGDLDLTRIRLTQPGAGETYLNVLTGHVEGPDAYTGRRRRLHSVIVGGESGRGARLFHVPQARALVAQCQAAGVNVFVKQLGEHPVDRMGGQLVQLRAKGKGGALADLPEDLRVRDPLPTTGGAR